MSLDKFSQVICKSYAGQICVKPPVGWKFHAMGPEPYYLIPFSETTIGFPVPNGVGSSNKSYKLTLADQEGNPYVSFRVCHGIRVIPGSAQIFDYLKTIVASFELCSELKERPDETIVPVKSVDTVLASQMTSLPRIFLPSQEPSCSAYFSHRTRLTGLDVDSSAAHWVNAGDSTNPQLEWSCRAFGSKCNMTSLPGLQYGLHEYQVFEKY